MHRSCSCPVSYTHLLRPLLLPLLQPQLLQLLHPLLLLLQLLPQPLLILQIGIA